MNQCISSDAFFLCSKQCQNSCKVMPFNVTVVFSSSLPHLQSNSVASAFITGDEKRDWINFQLSFLSTALTQSRLILIDLPWPSEAQIWLQLIFYSQFLPQNSLSGTPGHTSHINVLSTLFTDSLPRSVHKFLRCFNTLGVCVWGGGSTDAGMRLFFE